MGASKGQSSAFLAPKPIVKTMLSAPISVPLYRVAPITAMAIEH